ncbi:tail terminator [Gordonia phage Lozinak]|uniref:Tail terminator n=5 Tax=Smoothievirus TaxID=1982557 RepID=A0A2D1GFV9_9CAUD|nr:tail terminator [Gordonia phage Smoothie]YP_009273075.1 tail terminator [Gordonia phage ClubL]YP_009276153.1 tail terminator [Gordonia phage Bachita]YP_009281196.1 tail terminator [Gordonia phage Cucurbita]ATN90666.1 tail terminator [Gordonia phage Lozinak]AUE23677.1 tail terminator [Gordonia phage Toniann]QAU06905.1 tail terminator [Gordonia phage Aphelion]QKY79618.1 tail terminator [Gordonia Phage Engineer]QYC53525.1 tail terminator [Gordonia phage Norvs]WKW85839.1 tail terminator [Go
MTEDDIDAELLLMEHLDDLGYTDTAIPEWQDFAEAEANGDYFAGWDDILPIIVANRLPAGGIDADGMTDMALMAVVCIGRNRQEAWQTHRKVSARILNKGLPFEVAQKNEDGEVLGTVLIEPTSVVEAGALEPDFDPDNRFVEATFWVPISLRF